MRNTYILSAPSHAGYQRHCTTIRELRRHTAQLLGVPAARIVEVESPDGGTTYCYASQADADADSTGAYAVQYRVA